MVLLERLRAFLRRIETEGVRTCDPPLVTSAEARGLLIEALERLDTSRRRKKGRPGADPVDLLQWWQRDDRITRFVARLEDLLRDSFGHDADRESLLQAVKVALARELGIPEGLETKIRTAELDRLRNLALREVSGGRPHDHRWMRSYALEVRAIRAGEVYLELTPIGRVLLELTGRDAVRWLLHVETVQSIGPVDDWRVCRDALSTFSEREQWLVDWHDCDSPALPLPWATLQRLDALGVVDVTTDDDGRWSRASVAASAREILAEVVRDADSPLGLLASSLSADLTLAAAPSALPASEAGIADATARQARLVAHEIRNALLPVKTTLGLLYRELLIEPPTNALGRRRDTIDHGIAEVFRFVEELVSVSALASTPPEPLDPLPALRDALAALEPSPTLQVEVRLPDRLPPITGHRARVVTAFVNILRNAAQAGDVSRISLEASAIDEGRAVLVTIDDDGPGVPEDLREAIFDEGVSLRSGGTGLGLALVREVFEREMRGVVTCRPSPLGGARFFVRLPSTGTTAALPRSR